jgi:hypothetical protein
VPFSGQTYLSILLFSSKVSRIFHFLSALLD